MTLREKKKAKGKFEKGNTPVIEGLIFNKKKIGA